MWNDLQAATNRILYLESNLSSVPNYDVRIEEEKIIIQQLQQENNGLK